MMARVNITDRAQRYRAQNAVKGPRKCVVCGSRSDLGVMHLDGNESHGEPANLAYGCRSCNGRLAAAFKRAGIGRPTNQYNPANGIPTLKQYAWAVANHDSDSHAHDEGGAIIHATPPDVRIEYARAMAGKSRRTKRERADERWNPFLHDLLDPMGGWNTDHMYKTPKEKRAEKLEEIRAKAEGTARGRRKRAKENPWPFSRPDARRTTPASGGIAYHTRRKRADDLNAEFLKSKRPAAKAKAARGGFSVPDEKTLEAGFKRGLSLADMLKANPGFIASFGARLGAASPGLSARQLAAYYRERFGSVKGFKGEPYKDFLREYKAAARRNPASAAAEVFEEFHGFAPSETITVTKKLHYHKHLAAAGKLTHLDVWGIDGKGHHVTGFKGAFLAFNETKDQLFIEGGDQAVNLEDFGIRKPHELETLGRLTDIGYQTNKTHLGDEGGEAVYVHKFRSTNRDGRHVVVKIARYPDLIYDVRNEQLLFSGGSYEILREGINK